MKKGVLPYDLKLGTQKVQQEKKVRDFVGKKYENGSSIKLNQFFDKIVRLLVNLLIRYQFFFK